MTKKYADNDFLNDAINNIVQSEIGKFKDKVSKMFVDCMSEAKGAGRDYLYESDITSVLENLSVNL